MRTQLLISIIVTFSAGTLAEPLNLRSASSISRSLYHSRSLDSPEPGSFNFIPIPPDDLNLPVSTNSAEDANSESFTSTLESSTEYSIEAGSQQGDEEVGSSAVSPMSDASFWMYLAGGAMLLGMVGVALKKSRGKEETDAKLSLMEVEDEFKSTDVKPKGWRNKFRFGRKQTRNLNCEMVRV